MFDYLKHLDYKQGVSNLATLFENSPSIDVKYKAKEPARHVDRVGNIDFTSHPETKPEAKAETIAKVVSDVKIGEDLLCKVILSNCDTPFVEKRKSHCRSTRKCAFRNSKKFG